MHCFLSKVRLHLSSGCLNWTLTLQDLTVKSPHHLLLSESMWAKPLKIGQLCPQRVAAKEPTQLFQTSQAEWHCLDQPTLKDKVGLSCNLPLARQPVMMKKLPIHQENITWVERGDWKALRIIAAGKKKLANLKMQQWLERPGQQASYDLATSIGQVSGPNHLKQITEK